MPVIKCSNGKYRIGSGACIYDTEDKAIKVWKAIVSTGKYKADGNKISFDYDDTLTTDKGKSLAKKFIAEGKSVYIITRRSKSQEVINAGKEIGIPETKIIFTSGAMKWTAINYYGIGKHYDNNTRELELIKTRTEAEGVKI